MARIRTVKPEFWADEKLAPLPPLHRLVFLGLVSQADDAGRLLDSVKQIDGLLFPQTDDSCGPSLEVLHRLGVIERGATSSGQQIIQIVGWKKHQKVDHPNLRSALPPIARNRNGASARANVTSEDTREALASDARAESEDGATNSRYDLRSTTFDLRPSTSDQRASDPHARAHEEASPDQVNGEPPDFDAYQPTEAQRARAAVLHVDLDGCLRKWRANRKAARTDPAALDLAADFDGWLEREPGYANGNGVVRADPGPLLHRLPVVPWTPEPEPTPEERAEAQRIVQATTAALKSDRTPEPRKRRDPLSREQQLAIARGKKPEGDT